MVPVSVRAPGGLDVATLEGKLDTGADLSAVPERFIAELDLPPVRTVRAAGFLGELSTRRPYVILGRNVLRRLVVRLDGPGETLEIRLPRS
jgi:hypothetical protein